MGNVYVVSLDDGRETKVSNHWPRCRTYESPRWSPDSPRLIFVAMRGKGDMDINPFTKYIAPNIYVVDRDGSRSTNISRDEDVGDDDPTWCGRR